MTLMADGWPGLEVKAFPKKGDSVPESWTPVGNPATTLPLTGAVGLAGCDPQASWRETSFSHGWFISRLKASPSHCPSSAALPFVAWARGGLRDSQRSQQVHRPLHKSPSCQPGPGGGVGVLI